MPKGKTPLLDGEVALIQTWIKQGAEDDTPASLRCRTPAPLLAASRCCLD
jgi:hypothetical protein